MQEKALIKLQNGIKYAQLSPDKNTKPSIEGMREAEDIISVLHRKAVNSVQSRFELKTCRERERKKYLSGRSPHGWVWL